MTKEKSSETLADKEIFLGKGNFGNVS